MRINVYSQELTSEVIPLASRAIPGWSTTRFSS